MSGSRAEPFHIALANLRERLRVGGYPPGARIAAADVADALRLSATPVREALSRLAGEGLLDDRRGEGFFVRRPPAADIADLYRLNLAHLLIALEPGRPVRVVSTEVHEGEDLTIDPVGAVERLFLGWVAARGGRALTAAFQAGQIQLGPVRRLEPALLPDLAAEAAALTGLEPAARSDLLPRLRQFHARRIRLAEPLSALLERGG